MEREVAGHTQAGLVAWGVPIRTLGTRRRACALLTSCVEGGARHTDGIRNMAACRGLVMIRPARGTRCITGRGRAHKVFVLKSQERC